ncbi:MAG: DUF1186 domain-containing protein [Acidobacteriota bacterium]|nr:DUF1186 domain-containing protein [Acidobacteriota bacterium]
MEILRYSDLDVRGLEAQVDRTAALLRAGDFRAADARKMAGSPFYRARLNDKDRLLFRFVMHGGQSHLVLLEVIRNHAYEKSRFLNGAAVDEHKLELLPDAARIPPADILPLNFINPKNQRVHILDKILSLDEWQDAAYGQRLPLILIGSAGSGKTVLTLEKLKQMSGDVLYVTHSPYLVENARGLYYASGYENEEQNLSFLSFQEFVETIRVPPGTVVDFRIFSRWFARHRQASGLRDAHQIFEEFNGVITGSPVTSPYLSRTDYIALGVRRSIFNGEERSRVYDLFLKYLDFLKEEDLADLNLLCFQYHEACRPSYDAIVVDEVQDLTNVQLSLVLRALRHPERFILCGDSNQIVHPNFFSWAALKTLFYESRLKTSGDIIRILNTNYRNAPEVTDLANRLLLLKNARFGSIDRESHYLVRPISENHGRVEFLADTDAVKREFDARTSRSTRFAVLVMRPEDKDVAARYFRTPLLFSIQEAKGLEYENIILFNFVSGSSAAFRDVTEGVDAADLEADFSYSRAKDKTDRSLEAYKFYVNALYVAMTRAVQNLYIIEQDTGHRLFRLLGLDLPGREVKLKVRDSTAEEWQAEARRLELQGKKEQAEAIRRRILETQPVPWPVITPDGLPQLEAEALNPQSYNRQAKMLLFEYAVMYSLPRLYPKLAALQFRPAFRVESERAAIENKYTQDYQGSHPVLNQKIERYGIDFRNPLNQTPLMVAARMGRQDLVRELVAQGANTQARDNWGRMPLQIALHQAYIHDEYAQKSIGGIYPLLAPSALKVRTGGRLIKLDSHTMEFFLLHSMVALFEDVAGRKVRYSYPAFETADFVHSLEMFPFNVIPAHRRRRAYISSVLARNELHRDDPGNRRLFLRVSRGFYVPNPAMDIEIENALVNVCDLLHLDTMEDGAEERLKDLLDVMRHVRKEGKLETSSRLRPSPFHNTPIARPLESVARRVRGEDVAWEDEWDAKSENEWEEEAVQSFRSNPETPDRPQQDAETAPSATVSSEEASATAERKPEEKEPERTDAPSAIPSEEAPQAASPPPAAPDLASQPEPARPVIADESSGHAEAIPQSGEMLPIEESPDTHPPLPPLIEVQMPEYTTREQQMLWRIKYPVRPFPLADFQRVVENMDRFRPALLDTVQMMLDPQVKEDLMAERFSFMGYIAATYILAGSRDPALLPLLLRITIDPDLARFHLRHDRWLPLPRILATVVQDDPAPVLRIAEWDKIPVVSLGLILRTLGNLFLWKRIPRETVVQTLREVFELGIPASDLDLWDVVLDACWAVHPREVMPYLRRQLSPAICRKLDLTRADLEMVSRMPVERMIADVRARCPGPVQGLDDFVPIVTGGSFIPEEENEVSEIQPVHAGPKVGRNDPCPCGSGRKYKKCCGAGQ